MENQVKTKRVINTDIDKREAIQNRDIFKTIGVFTVGVIYTIIIGSISIDFYNSNKIIGNKEHQIGYIETSNNTKQVDNTGLSIVYKVSKDYRKYFLSYKQYVTNKDFEIKITEIDFGTYMFFKEGDTLSNTHIKLLDKND